MNRREFVKGTLAIAGTAIMSRLAFANEGEKKMKSIVIYFSHTGENYSVGNITVGNTAKVAAKIAAATGAATWEIEETDPYPVAYNDCIARAKKELKDKARPAFAGTAPDLSDVDTIYLGYPNWWGDAPMIVYSYLDKAAIDGKTILPFCTHEGSGLASMVSDVKRMCKGADVKDDGLAIKGSKAKDSKEKITEWL